MSQIDALDKLHELGFKREEDCFVLNKGEEFMEQIHIDTIAALASAPAQAGVSEVPLSDNAIGDMLDSSELDLGPEDVELAFAVAKLTQATVLRNVLATQSPPPAAPAYHLSEVEQGAMKRALLRSSTVIETAAPAPQVLPDDSMGIACLAAWDRELYGPEGAVHPMYLSAFEAGWRAALQGGAK